MHGNQSDHPHMAALADIHSFLETREFAVAGVSRDPKKFGRRVYEHLRENGYQIYPVNPNAELLNGEKCYRSIAELPAEVDRIYIVTPADQTAESVRQSLDRGIRNIWIQQRSESPEAIDLINGREVNLIHNECIFMFAEPVKGGHAFHRFFSRLFGSYPK